MKVDKSKQVNLKLSVYLPLPDGCNHARAYMKKLGITYKYAVPQSVSDSWWFLTVKMYQIISQIFLEKFGVNRMSL